MKSFIHPDFLLSTPTAQKLYHEYAEHEPIFDYHCHLSPKDIAEDRQFGNLFEIWLEGDHYKWRAMRQHGVAEPFCTGNASPKEKFMEFAKTVPYTIRNPIFHWTHLELKRYFGIDTLLNGETAERIWEQVNEQLTAKELSTQGILYKFNVKMVGTTDDPTDDLHHHLVLKSSGCPAEVLPTFRPDKAMITNDLEAWNAWVDRLASCCNRSIDSFADLKEALSERVDFFDSVGCKASDHGLLHCPTSIATDEAAAQTFERFRLGQADTVSPENAQGYAGNLLAFLGECYHRKNWVMQLHLGAARNVNGAVFEKLGADKGCDSIADELQIASLGSLLGELSSRGTLPKAVLYNLNPRDNYAFATMCGNFFEKGIPHKIQFGSGWWFLDQWEGMTMQLNAFSSLGLLSHFVGMLTDSRSFMSFPRHEYFRRLLCELMGNDLNRGMIPMEMEAFVGARVRDICYVNAATFFDSPLSNSDPLT